jgi:hypothetical protein
VSRWWRFRKGERRRGRGEVEKRDIRSGGENIELRDMKRRNRGSESSSIYAGAE